MASTQPKHLAPNSRPRKHPILFILIGVIVVAGLVVGEYYARPYLSSFYQQLQNNSQATNAQQGTSATDATATSATDSTATQTDEQATADGETAEAETPEPVPAQPVKIEAMMIGDILMHDALVQSGAQDDGSYNYDFLFAHEPLAAAMRASLLDALAATAAGVAHALGLHRAEHRALHAHLNTAAVAGGTGLEGSAVLGTGAVAMFTRLHAGNAQLFLGTLGNLAEVHLDAHSQIGATVHALGLTAATAAKEVTEATKAAETAKQVSELAQDVLHRHAATIASATHLIAGKTKLVITGALIGVAEDVIGLGSLLEFLLGSLFLGIALALLLVRVVLDSQFAIGFLQVIGSGVLLHAQHLVVISLLSHFSSSF